MLVFEPSALEVHLRTAEWFWDQEVYDFVAERLDLIESHSMRTYRHGWELKEAGMDWRAALLERWLSGARLLVAKVKADPSYGSEEERALAFVQQGGGCRATYFNHARRFAPAEEVPRIILRNLPPEEVMPHGKHTRQRLYRKRGRQSLNG